MYLEKGIHNDKQFIPWTSIHKIMYLKCFCITAKSFVQWVNLLNRINDLSTGILSHAAKLTPVFIGT